MNAEGVDEEPAGSSAELGGKKKKTCKKNKQARLFWMIHPSWLMCAFATAVEAALPETGAVPDSFFLGLSCILLLGYTVFRVFGALRLPGAVGVMLAGCLLSPFAGPAIHVVLPSIQASA